MTDLSPTSQPSEFTVSLAQTASDVAAAQALRYDVFVRELGGDGPMVDHDQALEQDRFDAHCDHLLLRRKNDGQVVGVYRVMQNDGARACGGFYPEAEFDLTPLKASGKRLLELGRSCLHPSVRGGVAMLQLWAGLARYIEDHKIDILFGVASYHGTDTSAIIQSLSMLHRDHLAPQSIRPTALINGDTPEILPSERNDRKIAMQQTPQLIKAYLRLGGMIGQGVYVDHAFNTTDVSLVLDVSTMTPRQRQIYQRGIA